MITLKLSPEQEEKLYQTWQDAAVPVTSSFIRWQLRPEQAVITCYRSGKTVFQGRDAAVYAAPFQAADSQQPLPQAGSDEVGTGDYFGPVCVCAAIVNQQDLPLIRELGVQDSKQISDAQIMKIAPQLMHQLIYSLLIVMPEKYNSVHGSYNMNAVKSLLHNQAYVNLRRKTALPEFCVIDQFTPEENYYRYLKGRKEVVRPMHFEVRAESKYPAVAAASVIARYAFLSTMKKMEKHYGMTFAKGSGALADECAREFVQKYGYAELGKAAKLHFRNTDKLISPAQD